MKVFVRLAPRNPCYHHGLTNEAIPTAWPLFAASLLAARLVWMRTKSSRLRISAHASSVILPFGRILSLAYVRYLSAMRGRGSYRASSLEQANYRPRSSA